MKLLFRYLVVLLLIIAICPIIQADDNGVLTQDLEYINCDLEDVIRDLAELGGFRVILDRQVQGEVSLTLMHGLTAKEAISTVARGYGYSSRWLNASTLMIGTSAFINGNFAARSTRIYSLKNADPVLVAEKLQTIVPGERIKINHETNELTITADIAEHQNISELINRLDFSNAPLNLEIRVEELTSALLKELQLDTDWTSTELGTIVLGAEQQQLLQDNPDRLLLGKSDLTCFNYQEAKLLLGDYLIKPAQLSNANGNQGPAMELECGTELFLSPSMLDQGQLQIKLGTAVKTIANNQPTSLRGLHSVIGLNFGETVLVNGVLQRNEYFNLKQTTTGYQYPILDNLFDRAIASDSPSVTRVVLLITPKLGVGNGVTGSGDLDASDTSSSLSDFPVNNGINNVFQQSSPTENENELSENPIQPEPAEKPVVIFDAVVVPENQPAKAGSQSIVKGRVDGDFYEISYTVKKGDTPIGIARRYGVELATILSKNNLNDSDVIKVDSILIVPVPVERTYVVKSKETLWRIAKRYGITIEQLMDLNGINDQTKVNQGQVLILPVSNQKVVNPQF